MTVLQNCTGTVLKHLFSYSLVRCTETALKSPPIGFGMMESLLCVPMFLCINVKASAPIVNLDSVFTTNAYDKTRPE